MLSMHPAKVKEPPPQIPPSAPQPVNPRLIQRGSSVCWGISLGAADGGAAPGVLRSSIPVETARVVQRLTHVQPHISPTESLSAHLNPECLGHLIRHFDL